MTRGKVIIAAFALSLISSYAMAASVSGAVFAPAVAGTNAAAPTVAGITNVVQGRMNTVRNSLGSGGFAQVGSDNAFASPSGLQGFANRIWASPFYNNVKMGTKDGVAGYDYDAWGVALGYDHAFGNFIVGTAFTYSRGDYDQKNVVDDIKIDNYGFSLYGLYKSACTGFFADVYGGYNYGDNDLQVLAGNRWAQADSHTNSYWLGGELGYDFHVNEAFTLTPTVGLTWLDSKSSNYTLNGVRYGKFTQKSLLLPIDLEAKYTAHIDSCSKVEFKVKGGYAYNFKNDGGDGWVAAGAGPQTPITGVEPGRHNWNVGAGVKYTRNQFDVGVDYRFDAHKKYKSHLVSATVGLNF